MYLLTAAPCTIAAGMQALLGKTNVVLFIGGLRVVLRKARPTSKRPTYCLIRRY